MKFLLFALFAFTSPLTVTNAVIADEPVITEEVASVEEVTPAEAVVYGYWTEGCESCCGGTWACAKVKPGINEIQ